MGVSYQHLISDSWSNGLISFRLEHFESKLYIMAMRPQDKQKILIEVQSRVKDRILSKSRRADDSYLDNLIHEVFYYEEDRLLNDRHSTTIKVDKTWLKDLRARFNDASESEKKNILGEIIDRHACEVVGHFSESMYQLSTSILPVALGVTLNAFSPLKLARSLPNLPEVADNVSILGDTDHLHKLQKRGTLIYVPTHSSNLDSIIMGYVIFRNGLPPVTYGAGLNLFQHRFLGFFMHRLGAYKVDRLKKHSLYKNVLKEYATVALENGYDNLFFPGGTRSRSGAIERKLKLGLLGCGIQAYYNNLKNGSNKPNLYIVPCTINYQLVLEAENLIEDHLKEEGKSRFIIVDDEFSMPTRIYAFLRNLVSLDDKIYMTFSKALDPFGNEVDDEGNSLDGRGRPIDISRYFKRNGRLNPDPSRDKEFTRQLGQKVTQAYTRDSVIFSSHVLAWTVFEKLREIHADTDFYRFLRTGAQGTSLPMVDVYRHVDLTLFNIRRMADQGKMRLSPLCADSHSEDVVGHAIKLFGSYHTRPALERKGDRLFPVDLNLLYYYRNRLWGYGLERLKS